MAVVEFPKELACARHARIYKSFSDEQRELFIQRTTEMYHRGRADALREMNETIVERFEIFNMATKGLIC